MDYIKKMLKSKTVWAGIIQIVTAISLFFTGEQNSHELLFGASGILMIIMRIITTQPLEHK
jgi:hypothetical protein